MRFYYATYRAEINALPCLPDEFEIVIQDKEYMSFREPLFDGYSCRSYNSPFSRETAIVYTKVKTEIRNVISVHDIIINRIRREIKNAKLRSLSDPDGRSHRSKG